MPVESNDAKEIFLAALEQPTPVERAAFLDQACARDAALRQRVEELLKAHEEAGSFLQEPATEVRDVARPKSEIPENQVGPYKLLQLLGEGGMGAVWMAEQAEPVRRRVAVKIIKAGMDSARVIARFEQERQALAMMDHPNIAKVLDAGTTKAQKPFFVMELIKGIPITKYCDQEHLTPRERLELFIPVCQAVQHAHQKGIIHRDLKPSNVLIALYDGKPIPKIIDFGVAKAVAQKLTDKTMFTEVGQMVGTLEYMAPEQAELNNLDIDTRADVYALGVILYELLTGSPPFSAKQLRAVAFDEMLRTIREVEPSRPSTKLSSSEQLASLAAKRKLEPKKLTRLVHGDLDWIVMKALEKDRSRRYETATGFAIDVQRYLADEPVSAGPPSTSYRLRKFLRRHKGPVLAAVLLVTALVGGITGTTLGLLRAQRAWANEQEQRYFAEQQKLEADDARQKEGAERVRAQTNEQRANRERERAEQEKQIAQAVRDFLQKKLLGLASLREQADSLLNAGAESSEAKRNPTVRELLDRAATELTPDKIESQFPKQPLVQAEILQTIGVAYAAVGELKVATSHLIRARDLRIRELGADHSETQESLVELGHIHREAGNLKEAIRLFEQVRDQRLATFGPDHPDTLLALNSLALTTYFAGNYSEAIRLLEHVRDKRMAKLGPDHRHTWNTLSNLGAVYQATGNFTEAIRLFRLVRDQQVVKLGPTHPDTFRSVNNLATAYQAAGKLPECIRLYEQVRELHIEKLGPDHPETLTLLNNLAVAYLSSGKTSESIRLLEQVRDLLSAKVGADHPHTLTVQNSLAVALSSSKKHNEAVALFEHVRDKRTAKLGANHPDTLMTLGQLASEYQLVGRGQESVGLLEQARDRQMEKIGADNPDTLTTLHNLAFAYWGVGRLPEAIHLYEQVHRTRIAKLGAEHPQTQTTGSNLAMAYRCAARPQESIPLYEQLRNLRESELGRDHLSTFSTSIDLAESYSLAGQFDRAHGMFRTLLNRERELKPLSTTRVAGVEASFGESLLRAGKPIEAEPLLRECLDIRQKTYSDDWRTFFAKSLLGGALLGQKKYQEAEPLLLAGYQAMREKAPKMTPAARPRLLAALDRLIELYAATGKKEEEAARRKEREALTKRERKSDA